MEQLIWWSRNLLIVAIPFFLVTMLAEWIALRRDRHRDYTLGYAPRDTAVSLSLGLIKLGMMALFAGISGALFATAYEHRLFTLPPTEAWTWPLLFLGDDLTFYWYHRLAHRVRLFWSEHVNHHSSQYYNLGTALRQSTLGPAYAFLYYLPLALIGFHPAAIALMAGISLLYQYWIHTETIDRMPRWFEAVFNTPSHHRVHHASNGIYLDRNYGGILIIWDRLFGTFQAELRELPPRYGLTHNINTYFLPKVIFHELAFLLRKAWAEPRWSHKLMWIFGPPEWTPNGADWPPDHPLARPAATSSVQGS